MYIKITISILVIHFILESILLHLGKKREKIMDEIYKTIKRRAEMIEKAYDLAVAREMYILKTMNDSMNVTDTKGFLIQRMKNSPKEFEPAKEEDVKPDNIKV